MLTARQTWQDATIGLDVHRRKISYRVKDRSGQLHAEGSLPATRFDLDCWMKTLLQPWSAAMEATMSIRIRVFYLKRLLADNFGVTHKHGLRRPSFGGMQEARVGLTEVFATGNTSSNQKGCHLLQPRSQRQPEFGRHVRFGNLLRTRLRCY
jgi:hypothetical protein